MLIGHPSSKLLRSFLTTQAEALGGGSMVKTKTKVKKELPLPLPGKVINDFSHAHHEYTEEKKRRKLRKKVTPNLRFCDCSKSIARFYLLELEYSQRKHRKGGFWNGQHEAYYLKEITRESMDIMRFVISASVGEARHGLYHSTKNCEKNSDAKKISFKILEQIFGKLGWEYTPCRRNSIYLTYIPERLFWKMLYLNHDLYSIRTWQWDFGGEPWRKGIALALKAYKAICLGDLPKIVIWIDTLINHYHNGGVLLNKFDCGIHYCTERLLRHKADGEIHYLRNVVNRSLSCSSANGQCAQKVPLAPGG